MTKYYVRIYSEDDNGDVRISTTPISEEQRKEILKYLAGDFAEYLKNKEKQT